MKINLSKKAFALQLLAEFHTDILNAFEGYTEQEEATYLLKKLNEHYEMVRNITE